MEVTTKARRQTKAGRFYEIDNSSLPSVTNILQILNKPALVPWAAKVEREMVLKVAADFYQDTLKTPPMSRAGWMLTATSRLGKEKASAKELAKASEIGTQVHGLIEWSLKGELMYEAGPSPQISDAAQWAFMAYQDWRKTVNMKPLFTEQVVYSRTHGYAGTLDLLAEINGELSVIDFKSGKSVYPESYLQNAAYRYAVREMQHGNPLRGYIVRLPKNLSDPEFEVKECPPEKDCMEVFLNAKRLWEWSQKNDTYKPPPEQNIEEKLKESLASA
jgi:hypothetical protein